MLTEIIRTSQGRAGLEAELRREAAAFLDHVATKGFRPRRLFFAIERYRRWLELNPEATLQARAATLQEVWASYALDDLLPSYPTLRVSLFRDTALAEASTPLVEALDELIGRPREQQVLPDQLSSAVADLRAQLGLTTEEDYFLARLSFPHLQPEDHAGFVNARKGQRQQSEMVVTFEDSDGTPYRIRHALSPKEVARLHQLFLAAKLPVQLRAEHRFLLAIGERDQIIGGLFYEVHSESSSAHMEKVVVSEPFRGKGVAGALIEELCNRLRSSGLEHLTTGFFRPQFFYRLGFTVRRRYAGLVRALDGRGESRAPYPDSAT
jgi:GNAT superfamily N-acetyltransferase